MKLVINTGEIERHRFLENEAVVIAQPSEFTISLDKKSKGDIIEIVEVVNYLKENCKTQLSDYEFRFEKTKFGKFKEFIRKNNYDVSLRKYEESPFEVYADDLNLINECIELLENLKDYYSDLGLPTQIKIIILINKLIKGIDD